MSASSSDRLANSRWNRIFGWRFVGAVIAVCTITLVGIWVRMEQQKAVSETPKQPLFQPSKLPKPPKSPSIQLVNEEGTFVYLIRTEKPGHELIVDCQTGKLISIRDHRGILIWQSPAPMTPESGEKAAKG